MSGRTPDEGRYSKVSRRMWGDARFQALSKAKPNAQSLWQRLLTGPELGCIPGLYPARIGGLADALGWPLKATKACWDEIATQKMAEADWTAGLVWVPNAIAHNEPQSPNTVIGWRLALRELPECELKVRALSRLRDFLHAKGEAWVKAFDEAIDKPSPKAQAMPSAEPSDIPCCNQEQEQDSEDKIFQNNPPDLDLDPDLHPVSASPEDLTGSARARTSEPSARVQLDPCLRSLTAPDPDEVWIFGQWVKTFGKVNAVFDQGRAACLAHRRLAGMTREDAAAALRGAAADDFVMGRKNGRRNDRLIHIFGDQERFEEYRDAGYALSKGAAPSIATARSQEAARRHEAWKLEQERKATEEAMASLKARGIDPENLSGLDLSKLVAGIG